MRRALPVLLALLAVAAAAGCGYRLQPGGEGHFTDPSVRMDLTPFANDSAEPDAGAFVAGKLREALRQRGFQGSFGRVGADYLVTGRVMRFADDVVSRTSSRFALENRFTLAVQIRVIDARRGNVLWKDDDLVETVSYYSGSDAQYTEANRRAAFEETVRRMVVRMAQTIRLIL
jgi:outer membrane lipopolysaccharide assembly protein LptE/RlpB